MSVVTGAKHVYVGMDITFLEDGIVQISNIDYIKETINLFGENVSSHAVAPAKSFLFETNEEAEKLSEPKRQIFHSCTAKLLYISKRSRPDIQTAVSYLTTRVSKANVDDWGKLKRLLQYLNGTIKLPLRISADNLHDIKC